MAALSTALILLIAALVLMMVRDQGAGPARTFRAYRDAAVEGSCAEMFNLLTPSARRQLESAEATCLAASGYDWDGADTGPILMNQSDVATVCTDPAHALPLRKIGGQWLVEAPRPQTHPECR